MKQQLRWITALLLFGTMITLVPGYFGWTIMTGVSGLVIKFFLGFCALILVAQVLSVLAVLRAAIIEASKRRKQVHAGRGPVAGS